MPKLPDANKPDAAEERRLARWSGADLGLHLMVSVIVVGALGLGLDRWLGWTPWGMLGGGLLGFISWVWVAFKTLGKKPGA